MNDVPSPTHALKLAQTSKGIFYIEKVEVQGYTNDQVITEVEALANRAKDMVQKLNANEQAK